MIKIEIVGHIHVHFAAYECRPRNSGGVALCYHLEVKMDLSSDVEVRFYFDSSLFRFQWKCTIFVHILLHLNSVCLVAT